VVLSTYNDARFLAQSVQSILDQSFRDFELVVVDDGSADDTAEVLAGFRDPRLRVLRNDRNLGLAVSLNRGIAMARGKYIARQDADTVSAPNRLELQVNYLERHPHVIVMGSNVMATDEAGNAQGIWALPSTDIAIKWTLLFRTPLIHPTVVMQAADLERVGFYSEDARFCYVEDYELWSRLCPAGTCANLPEPLMNVKCRRGGIWERHAEPQRRQIEEVSRRAMAAVGGPLDCNPDLWPVVQRFLYSTASEQGNWGPADVARAISALDGLYLSFSRAYKFPARDLKQHRRQSLTLWGKHCLGLGLRRNGEKNLRYRASLLASAAGLLSRAACLGVGT